LYFYVAEGDPHKNPTPHFIEKIRENFITYFSGLMVSFKLIWVGFSLSRRSM
jgi:hypothetical protein